MARVRVALAALAAAVAAADAAPMRHSSGASSVHPRRAAPGTAAASTPSPDAQLPPAWPQRFTNTEHEYDINLGVVRHKVNTYSWPEREWRTDSVVVAGSVAPGQATNLTSFFKHDTLYIVTWATQPLEGAGEDPRTHVGASTRPAAGPPGGEALARPLPGPTCVAIPFGFGMVRPDWFLASGTLMPSRVWVARRADPATNFTWARSVRVGPVEGQRPDPYFDLFYDPDAGAGAGAAGSGAAPWIRLTAPGPFGGPLVDEYTDWASHDHIFPVGTFDLPSSPACTPPHSGQGADGAVLHAAALAAALPTWAAAALVAGGADWTELLSSANAAQSEGLPRNGDAGADEEQGHHDSSHAAGADRASFPADVYEKDVMELASSATTSAQSDDEAGSYLQYRARDGDEYDGDRSVDLGSYLQYRVGDDEGTNETARGGRLDLLMLMYEFQQIKKMLEGGAEYVDVVAQYAEFQEYYNDTYAYADEDYEYSSEYYDEKYDGEEEYGHRYDWGD